MISLTYDEKKGLYRKCVGRWVKNGSPQPAKFWLGSDKSKAEVAALYIAKLWADLQAQGQTAWSPEALAAIDEFRGIKRSVPEASATVAAPSLTVHEAMDRFAGEVAKSNRAETWRYELVRRLGMVKERLPNKPLRSLTMEDVKAAKAYFEGRPKGYSVEYSLNVIRALKQFVDWLDLNELWIPPRRWKDAMKMDRWGMMRQSERERSGVKTFSLDELRTLYSRANRNLKLHILLALNTGMTQLELATLRKHHLRVKNPLLPLDHPEQKAWIDRKRQKTRGVVRVKWILWDRTRAALARYMSENNAPGDGYLIKTRDGRPLVWLNQGVRTDSVCQAWTRLIKKTGVRRLGFKYLRKTGSQLIRNVGGREMSEVYLAHTDLTTGRYYNVADYKRLSRALRRVEARLASVFESERRQKVAA